MQSTDLLYHGLRELLDRAQWPDQRHLKTAVNMIMGMIFSGKISLTGWIAYSRGRARQAQSVQRRFSRWLFNERLQGSDLYAPLIEEALWSWGESTLYLALDTTMLWDRFCMIRLSVVYRGRAVPLEWQVLEHDSARVAFRVYRQVLERAAQLVPASTRKVVLLADRGFADLQLMALCRRLNWHYRIRIKGNFLVYRRRHGSAYAKQLLPQGQGRAVFLHGVELTAKRYGPVHLALGRPEGDDEPWLVVSSEVTGLQTFREYGLRFDIEENFLDDKSNNFQLEESKLRSAVVIERLFFGIAAATLYLVAQGSEVVAQGRRREVDPHWFRGSSYLKIGSQWLKHAVHKGWAMITQWCLVGGEDPEPAMASRKQYTASQQKYRQFITETIVYET